MCLHFGKVRDVTDMIPLPVLIDIFPLHFTSADLLDERKSLENADRVATSTAEIVHLACTWRFDKPFHELHHVKAMDVVSDLFTLVTVNLVRSTFEIALDQVTQEPVQFDPAVIRAGQTPAPQRARRHPKVPTVLLHHHVRSHFRRPENGMFALIDPERLRDAVLVCRIGIIPARGQLDQRYLVWRVAIDLVRAHVNER